MKIPAVALQNALSARGLSVATLSNRIGMAEAPLRQAIEIDTDFDEELILSIANELAIPVQTLLTTNTPSFVHSIDFRSAKPGLSDFKKGTLEAISFVEKMSSTLKSIDINLELDQRVVRFETKDYNLNEAISLAKIWRDKWGLDSSTQLEWKSANKVYTSLRNFIENLGIIVIHRQFKTDEAAGIYIHVEDAPHTIVINTTKSSKARKLFTLAHEFCHVLLRAEGTSNPSIIRNKIEKFCNRFAACLLAPKGLITLALKQSAQSPSEDEDFIRLFANRLGISQEAAFLRLVDNNYLSRESYTKWKAKFGNTGDIPIGDTTDGGGGGTADPIRDKKTQFGTSLLSILGAARASGKLDEIDIYRLCGLKPKYQKQLFGDA